MSCTKQEWGNGRTQSEKKSLGRLLNQKKGKMGRRRWRWGKFEFLYVCDNLLNNESCL